ncbi:membrane protein [Geomicrobium sp. JCM 19037]|uniref:membrane protein n=1 Tax=unclassified Geomicrobium TaxID=2628951 RepID=UPI00045F3BFC|nr:MULTISPECIES: membrane protein [unclassified Geomicrobium]GAK03013.1 membrane protein [Geomicrobium sp. JCM 19037]GAK13929.1 membrane protein [Geomicrobium sp. JCM 19039]
MNQIPQRIVRSLQNNWLGIVLMIAASFSTAIGQFLWKLSGAEINVELIAGFMLYGAGAVLMIIAFRFGALSVLHPLLSIGYVVAVFLGVFFLQETLSIANVAGTILIVCGAVFIGGGDH